MTVHDPYRLGRRRFIAAAAVAGAAGALTLPASSASAQTGLPAGASRFVPLSKQERFADTRHPGVYEFSVVGNNQIRVRIHGRFGIPSTATAVVITVTAVNRAGQNYVTVFPSGGGAPDASNLNMAVPGEVAANLATVQLGGGSIDVFSFAACEKIIDVAGYYEQVTGSVEVGRYEGLPSAVRIHDARHSGVKVPLPAGWWTDVVVDGWVPAHATSVMINLTTTATGGPGYFSCYPLTQHTPPTDTSNLNVNRADDTRASAAVVAVSNDGSRRGFRVYAQSGGHVIVDLVGYFTGPGAGHSTRGLFVPVSPRRVLDTRSGPGTRGRLWPNWTVEARITDVLPSSTFDLNNAQAVVANVTAVDARAPGFYTVYAAGTARSNTSNVNASAIGQNIPNHVVTAVSNRGVGVFSETGGHVLIDLAGWFTGSPSLATLPVNNPPPPAAAPPWSLYVPRMRLGFGGSYGLLRQVRAGSSNTIVNTGNMWHWTGTGYVGQAAHIGLFGHRTEAGGPLRNQHELGNGDEIYLTVEGRPGDRRQFRYQVVREVVTGENPNVILNETRVYPGTTVSLISCTQPNQLPTNVAFRLITTAVLVAVTEDGIPIS